MAKDSVGRIGREVDEHTWVWEKPAGAKRIVIFVHGIFGRPDKTWDDTAEMVMERSSLCDLDWANWSYESSLFDSRDVTRVGEKLRPFLEARAQDYEGIYFICHSMGGLVVRDTCAQLCLSGDPKQQALYQRIRLAILIATPGQGSRWARALS